MSGSKLKRLKVNVLLLLLLPKTASSDLVKKTTATLLMSFGKDFYLSFSHGRPRVGQALTPDASVINDYVLKFFRNLTNLFPNIYLK